MENSNKQFFILLSITIIIFSFFYIEDLSNSINTFFNIDTKDDLVKDRVNDYYSISNNSDVDLIVDDVLVEINISKIFSYDEKEYYRVYVTPIIKNLGPKELNISYLEYIILTEDMEIRRSHGSGICVDGEEIVLGVNKTLKCESHIFNYNLYSTNISKIMHIMVDGNFDQKSLSVDETNESNNIKSFNYSIN